MPTQVRLTPDACPSCGQDIPAERLAEINGRIAARDREQEQAHTARLTAIFRAEQAALSAIADERLEQERRESAQRQLAAVQEANDQGNRRLSEHLAEADKKFKETYADLQLRLDARTTDHRKAEEENNHLKAVLETSKRDHEEQRIRERVAAAERENQLRASLKGQIEAAVTQRTAMLTAEHQALRERLEIQIATANIQRRQAEEQRATIEQQLSDLRTTKDQELAILKEQSARDSERARQEGIQQATTASAQVLKEKDAALNAARDEVERSQRALAILKQEQQQLLEAQLTTQRELLEQDKDKALSAERARAFEEKEKLLNTVTQLRRDLEKKTNEELGEGAEIDLYEALRTAFPEDDIKRIAKGTPGADIRHEIKHAGNGCGVIIYDSKNHRAYRSDHVTKLRADQLAARADHAILSTHKFPEGHRQVTIREGILLANPARVIALATMLRQHVIQLSTLRASNIERDEKTAKLYEFITSDRYDQLRRRVDERTDYLLKEQEKDKLYHDRYWRRQGESFMAIVKAQADLKHELSMIIGTESASDAPSIPSPEKFDFFDEFK